MARKTETGIEYFPVNTDIIHSGKIKLVVAECGSSNTWPVLFTLYCKIYREKGYWTDWMNEDNKLLFAQDECKIELSIVEKVVDACIKRSLFNKELFDAYGILTSDRIQENYLVAKSRNKEVSFVEEFALKNEKNEFVYKLFNNVNIIDLDVNIISKKVNAGTQKENKKKIIEGNGDTTKVELHTQEQLNLFKNFQDWILKDAPTVAKMKEPFTIDQYLTLKKSFNSEQLKDLILKMHNYKPLLSKNQSANLTFKNWARKDFNTNPSSNNLSSPGAQTLTEKKAADILKIN